MSEVKSLKDLVVLNDEAHHVHDEDLAWSQSLLAIHRALPKGLGLWLDFSATPKDQNGMYFPWTVCDYPLAQAVEDRIVKAPLIVSKEDDPKQPADDPENVTKDNVAEKYGYWLRAAVQRWKDHWSVYKKLAPEHAFDQDREIRARESSHTLRPRCFLSRARVPPKTFPISCASSTQDVPYLLREFHPRRSLFLREFHPRRSLSHARVPPMFQELDLCSSRSTAWSQAHDRRNTF